MADPTTITAFFVAAAAAVHAFRRSYEHYAEQRTAAVRRAERRKQMSIRRRAEEKRRALRERHRLDSDRLRRDAERRARKTLLASLSETRKEALVQRRRAGSILKEWERRARERLPQSTDRQTIGRLDQRQHRELRIASRELEASLAVPLYTIAHCDLFLAECGLAKAELDARSTFFKDAARVREHIPRWPDCIAVPPDLPKIFDVVWGTCSITRKGVGFELPCGIRAVPDDADKNMFGRGDHGRRRRVFVKYVNYAERTAVVSASMAAMLARFQAGKKTAYPARVVAPSAGGCDVLVQGMVPAFLPGGTADEERGADGGMAVVFAELDRFLSAPVVRQVPLSRLRTRGGGKARRRAGSGRGRAVHATPATPPRSGGGRQGRNA